MLIRMFTLLCAHSVFSQLHATPKPEVPVSPEKTPPYAAFVKPSKDILKSKLTPLQYKVTQEEGTETPFKNEYWDNKEAGIYVDLLSGEPLFASVHKYKSGTGWPSFWQPIDTQFIVEKVDRRLFSTRTEIRSRHGDAHLGHVFNDGPAPTGKRYCMNSAALKFIALADLKAQGYEEYVSLFKTP